MDALCCTSKLLMHDNLNLIMPFILKQGNTIGMNLKPRQQPSVCTSIKCVANHVLYGFFPQTSVKFTAHGTMCTTLLCHHIIQYLHMHTYKLSSTRQVYRTGHK